MHINLSWVTYIVTCRVARVTKITGSSSDDGIYSNHVEIFFLFRLQSLSNLDTKYFSGLTRPAYDWLV
jgi:hypothetical protein